MGQARLRAVRRRGSSFPEEIRVQMGSKLGILREGYIIVNERSDPNIFNVAWLHPNISTLFGLRDNVQLNPAGPGFSLDEATGRAFGELVERYSACAVDDSRLVTATHSELLAKGENASDPSSWALFAPDVYERTKAYVPFDRETNIRWIQGHDLATSEPTWLPAQLVHLGYDRAPGEASIGYGTSSGLAAGRTHSEAVLSGLCEAVERDAFVTNWYSRHQPVQVDWSDTPIQRFYEERLQKPGVRYHLFDITQDVGVPVFMGAVVNQNGKHAKVAVGASAHPDPVRAAFKALLEAAQGHFYAKQLQVKTPLDEIKEPIRNLEDNVALYAYPESFHRIAYLFGNPETRRLADYRGSATGDTAKDIATIVDRLAAVGLESFVTELTAPDVSHLGIPVVRCSVPGAAQFGVPAAPYLGCRRIYEVPEKLGWTDHILRPEELNREPHPFP